MSASKTLRFWVTCPQGVHGLLKEEIASICSVETGDWHKGVYFLGTLKQAYEICLWSRLANRVYLALEQSTEVSFKALEAMVKSIEWDEHIRPSGSLKVAFTGHLPEIRDTRFGAQKVKDWVVDQFRDKHGTRPDVSKDADLTIFAQVAKKRMFLAIELTGDSLHRRGYRQSTGPAPIKENLAAAMLMASKWPEKAARGEAFLDLMCGSGTLVVEAAMMAADYAPGLGRKMFGFERWLQHSVHDWHDVLKTARLRREAGIEKMPPVLGYDADAGVIASANETLQKLELSKQARCYHKDMADWVLPTHWDLKPGLWVSNPPYGERLGDKPTLMRTYRRIGEIAREQLSGWDIGILTSDELLARETGLRSQHKRAFYNGPIETTYYSFLGKMAESHATNEVQSEQITAFTNRINKNLKQLKKWRNKEGVEAFRVYDADIPEYAIAVDKYADWLHVQEYVPPKSIPEQKAQQRLYHAIDALSEVFEIPIQRIAVKRREKQKGSAQYEKNAASKQAFEIAEYGVKLKVNLLDYLDTGVFLDHRNMRQWIQQNSDGLRVLNLFCYTAAFTSHAYKGGAKKTVSVDLSKTYLNWGRENLELNGGKEGPNHQFIHADCMEWLKSCQQTFDLIIMDPPTFSNSARMKDTLDVQRDHVFLVTEAMRNLSAHGTLIFSNNYRKFFMDDSLYELFTIKDISNKSVPQDFKRKKPHRCFEIRHKAQ